MSPMRSFLSALTEPRSPKAAVSVTAEGISVLDTRRRNGAFVPLPEGIVRPAFEGANLPDPDTFARALMDAAGQAGLGRERRWAAALPGSTARLQVLTLESVASEREAAEMISWKAERLMGVPLADLRLTVTRLGQRDEWRYLLAAMSESVAREYEAVFIRLGWQVGMLLPRMVCESFWLQQGTLPNQMLLSVIDDDLSVMIVRRGEPILIRALPLVDEDPTEQLLRLLLFFRERSEGADAFADPTRSVQFEVLPVGLPIPPEKVRECITETFGVAPLMLDAARFGYGSSAEFSRMAAVGGLATLG
jgi:hypothetical protein